MIISAGSISPVNSSARDNGKFISSGLVGWYDFTDPTTMTLTGTRIDEIRDKNGSANKFATPAAGAAWCPSYLSSGFGGKGCMNLVYGTNRYLEFYSTAYPLSHSVGWTSIMFVKRNSRSGLVYATDVINGNLVLSTGVSERAGLVSANWNFKGVPRNKSFMLGTTYAAGVSGNTAYNVILNDTKNTINEGAPVGNPTGAFGKMLIGGLGGVANMGAGEVAGMLFFNRVLTQLEITQLYMWAKNYYGLTNIPSSAWNYIIEGNSLSVGFSQANSSALYDGFLDANGSPEPTGCKIFGIPGNQTPALYARRATLAAQFNASIDPKKNIFILLEGINHINQASPTAAVAYNALKDYCVYMKAAGFKTILCTITPLKNKTNVNYDTVRLAVNQMIRDAKTAGETWLDAVADIGGDPLIGATGASDTTTYYGDGTHFNVAGNNIAKVYVTNAINAITA